MDALEERDRLMMSPSGYALRPLVSIPGLIEDSEKPRSCPATGG